jgi:hypothetical protein
MSTEHKYQGARWNFQDPDETKNSPMIVNCHSWLMANPQIRQFVEIARQIEYKPGCQITVHAGGYSTSRQYEFGEESGVSFAFQMPVMCVVSKQPTVVNCLGYIPPGCDSEEGMLHQIMGCIENMEIHEAQEHFTYRGVKTFDPHAGELPTVADELAEIEETLRGKRPQPPVPTLDAVSWNLQAWKDK